MIGCEHLFFQRERQAALGRFKAQVEARVGQTTGESGKIPA